MGHYSVAISLRQSRPAAFGSALRNLLVQLLQLGVKAWLAHSACFAAVASREMVTAGWTIELRVSGYVAIWHGGCFRPTLDALLTDDVVTSDAESGHQRLYLA